LLRASAPLVFAEALRVIGRPDVELAGLGGFSNLRVEWKCATCARRWEATPAGRVRPQALALRDRDHPLSAQCWRYLDMQAAFHCYSLNNVLLTLRHQRLQAHSATRVLACAIASKRWSLHWRRSSSPSQNHGNRLPRWVYARSCSESLQCMSRGPLVGSSALSRSAADG
jgi:hypothetical protein